MARSRGGKLDRRSSPFFVVMVAVVVYVLYSVTVAFSTADKCGSASRQWELFPPGWECQRSITHL